MRKNPQFHGKLEEPDAPHVQNDVRDAWLVTSGDQTNPVRFNRQWKSLGKETSKKEEFSPPGLCLTTDGKSTVMQGSTKFASKEQQTSLPPARQENDAIIFGKNEQQSQPTINAHERTRERSGDRSASVVPQPIPTRSAPVTFEKSQPRSTQSETLSAPEQRTQQSEHHASPAISNPTDCQHSPIAGEYHTHAPKETRSTLSSFNQSALQNESEKQLAQHNGNRIGKEANTSQANASEASTSKARTTAAPQTFTTEHAPSMQAPNRQIAAQTVQADNSIAKQAPKFDGLNNQSVWTAPAEKKPISSVNQTIANAMTDGTRSGSQNRDRAEHASSGTTSVRDERNTLSNGPSKTSITCGDIRTESTFQAGDRTSGKQVPVGTARAIFLPGEMLVDSSRKMRDIWEQVTKRMERSLDSSSNRSAFSTEHENSRKSRGSEKDQQVVNDTKWSTWRTSDSKTSDIPTAGRQSQPITRSPFSTSDRSNSIRVSAGGETAGRYDSIRVVPAEFVVRTGKRISELLNELTSRIEKSLSPSPNPSADNKRREVSSAQTMSEGQRSWQLGGERKHSDSSKFWPADLIFRGDWKVRSQADTANKSTERTVDRSAAPRLDVRLSSQLKDMTVKDNLAHFIRKLETGEIKNDGREATKRILRDASELGSKQLAQLRTLLELAPPKGLPDFRQLNPSVLPVVRRLLVLLTDEIRANGGQLKHDSQSQTRQTRKNTETAETKIATKGSDNLTFIAKRTISDKPNQSNVSPRTVSQSSAQREVRVLPFVPKEPKQPEQLFVKPPASGQRTVPNELMPEVQVCRQCKPGSPCVDCRQKRADRMLSILARLGRSWSMNVTQLRVRLSRKARIS